ncbi:hypothetical protein D6853_12970 [Butyrivibrio sp. X503]|uniref:hypothetical protein n=1 Tax=Butyrivibrio sp. X503 TaxID=2364878 RepID=UPI000EAA1EBF|nr:hypothetical protein [Butyrivibrio sp. X503]RKM54433.1 hypothetical protein D6853_12970 [Butyrivibrio sp. X503]
MDKLMNMGLYASQFIEMWNENLILVSYVSNQIYIIDPKEHVISDVISINGTGHESTQYRSFCCYNNFLFLFPYNAQDIIKVDLISKKQFVIRENITIKSKDVDRKFYRVIRYNDIAYVLGEAVNIIMKVDLENDNCIGLYSYDSDQDIYWSSSYVIYGDVIYVPCRTRNAALCINIKTDSVLYKDISTNGGNGGFLDIYEEDQIIHLFDEIGNEYLWNPEESKAIYEKGNKDNIYTSRQCVKYKNKIFRIALHEDLVLCREGKNSFNIIQSNIVQKNVPSNGSRFQEGIQHGQFYYFQSRNGIIYMIDMEQNIIEEVWIKKDSKALESRKEYFISYAKRDILKESEEYDLTDLIEFV